MTTQNIEQFDIDMTLAMARAGLQSSGTKGKDVALATIESLFADKESDDAESLFWDTVQMLVEQYGVKAGKMSKTARQAMESLGRFEKQISRN